MLDYFYSKGLYTIHKIGGKYHVLRTKITKEQYEHMKNVYMNEVDELGRKIRKDEDFIPFLML